MKHLFLKAILILLMCVGSMLYRGAVFASSPIETTTQSDTPTTTQTEEKIIEQRVTLNFDSIRLEDILMAVSRQTGVNFITTEEIRDIKFRVYLKDVPLLEALEALISSHGLVYEKFPESNIFVVKKRTDVKPRVVTRVYRLKYIQLSSGDSKDTKRGASKSGISFIDTTGGAKSSTPTAGAKSAESSIVSVVQSVLSENGKLQIDPYSNSLIITDLPERFPQITELIEKLDVITPQIFIEVEIIEINSDAIRKIGIEYGLSDGTLAKLVGPARVLQFPTSDKNQLFPSPAHLEGTSISSVTGSYGSDPSTGVHFGILSFLEFQAILKAIELSGEGKFLARPKVLTMNNKPAVISVTAETAVGVQSASVAQTGLLVETAERYTTGITIRVTPHVNEDGYIALMIEPMVSRPRSSEFFPGRFVDPQSAVLNSSVMVKDGQTVLIGGLLTTEEKENVRKVPFFGHIPLFGALFTNKETLSIKKELMIFITPRKTGYE